MKVKEMISESQYQRLLELMHPDPAGAAGTDPAAANAAWSCVLDDVAHADAVTAEILRVTDDHDQPLLDELERREQTQRIR